MSAFVPRVWSNEVLRKFRENIALAALEAPLLSGLRILCGFAFMERVAQVTYMVGNDQTRVWFADAPPVDLDYDETLTLKLLGNPAKREPIGLPADPDTLKAKLLIAVSASNTQQ